MFTLAPSQPRLAPPARAALIRSALTPRRRAGSSGARAMGFVFGLIVILGALTGCAHEPIISPFTAPPPLTATAPHPGQAAAGLVGVTTPVPSPTAALPTAPPLRGTALPQPALTPIPVVGGADPLTAAVAAADLIAAGSALQFAGACEEAIPLYEQAITLDPGFSNVYTLLAFCRYNQGRIDAAMARWQEALQRDAFSPDALAGLGTALYRQGQLEAGLERYRQAVEVNPGYRDAAYLHIDQHWDGPILLDSQVLRTALLP